MAKTPPILLKDFIGGFLGGVDAGIDPHLLPKNKLAWLVNGTVRGGYVNPRPRILNYNLSDGGVGIISGTGTVVNFVMNGLFLGATFYNPTKASILPAGTMFALISGRLFGFTPDYAIVGGAYAPSLGFMAVVEYTINNGGVPDLNSSTATKAWLGQAENYLIVQDGVTPNPLVFDGNKSFRSLSSQTQIGVFNATAAVAPAIGQILPVTAADFSTAPTTTTPKAVAVYSGATGAYLGMMALGFPPAGFYNAILNTVGTHIFSVGDVVYLKNTTYSIGSGTPANVSYAGPYSTAPSISDGGLAYGIANASNFVAGSLVAVVTVNEYRIQNGAPYGTAPQFVGTTTVTSAPITNSMITQSGFTPQLPSDPNGSLSQITGIVLQYQIQSATPTISYSPIGTIASVTGASSPYGVTFQNNTSYPSSSTQGATVFVGTNSTSPGSNYQCTISSAPAPGSVASYSLTNQSVISGTALANCVLQSLIGIPCGKAWAYSQGRLWTTLPNGTQFVAGDIVGGSSGTGANNYLDAILYTMQNTLLSNGGTFSIPGNYGQIRAMFIPPTMNVSLGQGPLQVSTPQCVFSVNAPADITTWASLTYPIVTTSLIGSGAVSNDCCIAANDDVLFRSPDGIRSMTIASLDFYKWNQTPCSNEVRRALDQDDTTLIHHATACNFDGRIIFGTSPVNGANGVYFQNAVVINTDTISNLQSKSPSVWEGVWNGLNALQFVTGIYGNKIRNFVFTSNGSTIGVSEMMTSAEGQDIKGTSPATLQFESPILFDLNEQQGQYNLFQLEDGEIYFDSILGSPTFKVEFRPDYDQNWHLWYSWSVDNTNLKSPYKNRAGLGVPVGSANSTSGIQNRDGYDFQVRVTISGGSARFLGMMVKASVVPESEFAKPIVSAPAPAVIPTVILKQVFAGNGPPVNQNPSNVAGIYFDALNKEFYLWLGTQWDGGIIPTGTFSIVAGRQAFSGSGAPTLATPTPAGNAGTYWDYTNQAITFWNPAGYWGDDPTATGSGVVANTLGQDYLSDHGTPTTQKPANGAGMYYDLDTLTLYNWNTPTNSWI
jgi:hypothetical protein